MPKKANLINYPHLNDRGGDLSQIWYVEWSFRLPNERKSYRFRSYDGMGAGTAESRREAAQKVISQVNEYLKSGAYLSHGSNYNPVRQGDDYRPEAKEYKQRQRELQAWVQGDRFLKYTKTRLRKKSYTDYKGKLNRFVQYVETVMGNKPVVDITRPDVIQFFENLANSRSLSQKTIEKYMQVVRMFFEFLEDVGIRDFDTNPVKKVPKFGKVIDCSPGTFTMDDRERLKNAIQPKEPYLWLACEFQYYCAVRPGTELRLARIGMIDRERRTITIPATLAKNKSTQSVGIPKVLMDECERLGIFNYPENYYIFGRYGIPAPIPTGKNTLRNRFNMYRQQLKISKDKKFYSWKHTGAVSAAENGMPLLEMKDYLRHSDVNTTMEYLKKRVPVVGSQEKYIDKL